MAADGIQPNLATFNIVLEYLSERRGHVDVLPKMLQMIREMKKCGIGEPRFSLLKKCNPFLGMFSRFSIADKSQ